MSRVRETQRVLGEFALGDFDLAASADAASAAHRIEVDAELARRFEHADAIRDLAAFAGGRENDKPGRHCSASRALARSAMESATPLSPV